MFKRDFKAMDTGSTSSPYVSMFEEFRSELDEHYDRRERIIKASRDITAASKKLIFTLQRVRQLQQPLPGHVIKGNKPHLDNIASQFSLVSTDLQDLNAYRYARQISGGCQEFVEAASFEHYLTNARLLSHAEANELMKSLDANGPGVDLSAEDYLLGIYDMTGELMKFSITAMATNGTLPLIASSESIVDAAEDQVISSTPRNILTDMRDLRSAMESLTAGSGPFAKDVEKKMEVMQASVEKVEKALYSLTVRGAERPKGWVPDTIDTGLAAGSDG